MGGNAGAQRRRRPHIPGRDDARSRVQFAFGDLFNNLPQLAVFDSHLHVPTLAATVGAIAGYSAQCAWGRNMAAGQPACVAGGDDEIERAILFRRSAQQRVDRAFRRPKHLCAWSMIAGAAVAVERPAAAARTDVYAHVSGDRRRSRLLPGTAVAPKLPGLELLKRVWPLACGCFEGRLSGKVMRDRGRRAQILAAVIAAHVAHYGLRQTQASLDPATGVAIAFRIGDLCVEIELTAKAVFALHRLQRLARNVDHLVDVVRRHDEGRGAMMPVSPVVLMCRPLSYSFSGRCPARRASASARRRCRYHAVAANVGDGMSFQREHSFQESPP